MGVTGAAPTGLSPRVRGSRMTFIVPICISGSIPACAGEPRIFRWNRTCSLGLSPRVRGSPDRHLEHHHRGGSIPACAGEPRRHPAWPDPATGLSPRVCGGAAVAGTGRRGLRGSIPACAGGARRMGVTGAAPTGLSPRVRGSRMTFIVPICISGSIPACAGEPAARWSSRPYDRGLSPRVRGSPERFYPGHTTTEARGLSPRVRGEPRRVRRVSIPACAGEPPACRCAAPSVSRSIPACAGEPGGIRAACVVRSKRSIPACAGGAMLSRTLLLPWPGLSPRVRGSPMCWWYGRIRAGSIPACAGEPATSPASCTRIRVYPRVCGGARRRRARRMGLSGLSPRVRGSLRRTRGRCSG